MTSRLGLEPAGEDQCHKEIKAFRCLSPAPVCRAGGVPAVCQVCDRPAAWFGVDGRLLIPFAKAPLQSCHSGTLKWPKGRTKRTGQQLLEGYLTHEWASVGTDLPPESATRGGTGGRWGALSGPEIRLSCPTGPGLNLFCHLPPG